MSIESSDPDQMSLRFGGWAAITGSVLGMVGNLIHPMTPIGDPLGTAQVIAESRFWVPIHLAIVIGVFLMTYGLYGLAKSIRGEPAATFARFGLIAAVIGITVGLLLVIMDGVGAKQLAEEWAAAPAEQQAAALRIVSANETINFSIASLFNLVFAGATFLFFGLAVARSKEYATGLGWVAVTAGILSIGAGIVQAYTGEPTAASRILTIIGPTVITVWLLYIGTVLLRRSRGTSPSKANLGGQSS